MSGLRHTGVSGNLEPLDHLLPLLAVGEGGARLRHHGELGDSKQSQDAVVAQRSREGDKRGFARHATPPPLCHLGEKKKQD